MKEHCVNFTGQVKDSNFRRISYLPEINGIFQAIWKTLSEKGRYYHQSLIFCFEVTCHEINRLKIQLKSNTIIYGVFPVCVHYFDEQIRNTIKFVFQASIIFLQ
jgi:hypothetical protein